MHGVGLRDRRTAAGLSLRQVARAAGTSATNISSYERGTKTPNARTLRRLLAAIEAGSSSPIYRMNLLTAPALSSSLRKAVRDGWTTTDRLRLVREMRSNFRHVENQADRDAFLAEPSTTGDARWDALAAGNVENIAIRAGLAVPEWSRGHARSLLTELGQRLAAGHARYRRRVRPEGRGVPRGEGAGSRSRLTGGLAQRCSQRLRTQPTGDRSVVRSAGLSVGVASAEYLFVMKARSARPGADRDDPKLLARAIGMTNPDLPLDLIERYYGSTPMSPKVEFFLREVMDELTTERKQEETVRRRGAVQHRDAKGRFGPTPAPSPTESV